VLQLWPATYLPRIFQTNDVVLRESAKGSCKEALTNAKRCASRDWTTDDPAVMAALDRVRWDLSLIKKGYFGSSTFG
jgi:hypothetical protein